MADFQPFTWNGQNINDSSPFISVFPPGQKANLSANVVSVPRADDDPFLSDTQLGGHVLVLEVYIAAGQNIDTNREVLKKYFNVRDKTRHNLIVKDAGSTQYYQTGFVTGISPLGSAPKNGFAVRLQVEHQYWQLNTATADAWVISGTGDTQAITNSGNIKVPPLITLTPTTTKGAGLAYRRYVGIYNNLDKSFVAPLDITSGGIDTATLTTSKMQTSGADFRIWQDGTFADRWLNAMDTANTLAWVNFSLAPRKEIVLLTAVSADSSTFEFTQTRASLQVLRSLKQVANTTLKIESEYVTFVVGNIDLVNYQITSVVRGAKGSTAAAHAAAVTVRHIEHDLWILYGDSTLTAPDVDDDYKPIISLASTNASWVWTNFFDDGSNRSAMWTGGVESSKTGLSYVYTESENNFVDPSTELGLALINYGDSRVQFEAGVVAWTFTHPAGVSNVAYDGEKYTTVLTSWAGVVGLQYLQSNAAWFTAYNEPVPAVALTWEAFSRSVALGDTYEAVRFVIDGALTPTTNTMNMAEFDTLTATIGANIPTIALLAEAAINFFDFKITNNTTGEYIKITTPCAINTVLTIDAENKEAYLADGTRCNVTLSTDRADWLDLAVGSNTLQFDDVGTVAITGVVTHRDRVL